MWRALPSEIGAIDKCGLLLLAVCVTAVLLVHQAAAADSAPDVLTVMSFNLRRDGLDGPEHAWSVRKESAAAAIQAIGADIVGTQEGTYPMLQELMALLPGYDWVGMGRGGGLSGEFMAVLYRTDRFQVVAAGHFWLSETPEIPGSRLPGVANQRMVTWVWFRERATGAEFLVYNTHLDHQSQYAREYGAQMIHDHVAKSTQLLGIPAVVTGDMNAGPSNAALRHLLGSTDRPLLHDAGDWLRARGETVGATFHGYSGTVQGEPIDYILYTEGLRLLEFGVARDRFAGRFPSDHYPVWARFAPLSEVVTFEQFQEYFTPELQNALMRLLTSAGYSDAQITELFLQAQQNFPDLVDSLRSRLTGLSPHDLATLDVFSLLEPELRKWVVLPETQWAQVRVLLEPFLRNLVRELM